MRLVLPRTLVALAVATLGNVAAAQPVTPGAPGPDVALPESVTTAAAPVVEPAPAVVAAPAAAVPAPTAEAPAAEAPRARLDYSDGSFYLRSVNDNLVFVPSGRVHVDTYAFGGPGVGDYHRSNGTGLKANLFFRRFVIEFGGIVRKKWFYWVGGNFAPTSVDAGQNPISTANVYDGFIGYQPNAHHRIYVGQYNAPFTMENTTSSRWLDLMERALAIRTLATPYNKADGITFWGETKNNSFEYQVGVFGGDGMNRPNVDNRVDGMARFVVRPLAGRSDALKRFHLGIGGRIGGRDSNFVRYNTPNLTTPGGYAFWTASYTDSDGRKMAILQDGLQAAISGEFYLPFERWDVRGEIVYLNEQRREAADSDRTMTVRTGLFSGLSGYAQLSFWLLGTPRINGNPAGKYGVLRVPDGVGTQAKHGLQLVVRGELVRMNYASNSRSGTPGAISSRTENVNVNAYQIGINYWATKHIRLSAEYSLYQFIGGAASNQAIAPGRVVLPSGHAHMLNEISFRLGLAL